MELRNVGKRYTKYDDVPTLIGRALRLRTSRGPKRGHTHLWAVRNVDLQVQRGETLGILGQNGSGKSTLLAMMAGVTAPTEGVVRVRGRVAPLIAVGVGFHPELTGRENIYVNGTILGLTTAEITHRIDDIVEFAEIPEFIDTPVKFYSSGMFVRLGFAIAVASDPHLFLVDEVLAVGDLAFQVKCFLRLRELQDQGATIVTVSHNLTVIRNLCSRVLVLNHGAPEFLGDTSEGVSIYHSLLTTPQVDDPNAAVGDPVVELSQVRLLRADGSASAHFTVGEQVVVDITIQARRPIDDAVLGISVASHSGVLVYSETTFDDRGTIRLTDAARCQITFGAELASGSYTVQALVQWDPLHENSPYIMTAPAPFYVSGRHLVDGLADLKATFVVAPIPLAGDAGTTAREVSAPEISRD